MFIPDLSIEDMNGTTLPIRYALQNNQTGNTNKDAMNVQGQSKEDTMN